jgi:hypothetical protein
MAIQTATPARRFTKPTPGCGVDVKRTYNPMPGFAQCTQRHTFGNELAQLLLAPCLRKVHAKRRQKKEITTALE